MLAHDHSSAAMNMVKFRPVTHVIFDVDGLLLRTEQIYEEADSQMIAKYTGRSYPVELRQQILGSTEQKAVKLIIDYLQLPLTVEKYLEEVNILLDETLKRAPLMKGAERLVKHLHSNNIPIAVATSSGEDWIKKKITNHKELFSLFNHIVTGGSDPEVKEGKPAPDVFLVCASRFPDKPAPEKCLVFEDSPNGVKAALKANMQVVWVPEDHTPKEVQMGATCMLDSLSQFKPEQFGLPPI